MRYKLGVPQVHPGEEGTPKATPQPLHGKPGNTYRKHLHFLFVTYSQWDFLSKSN